MTGQVSANGREAGEPTAEQPITRAVLLDALLGEIKDVSRVQIREIRILPGHAAGLHIHNGPVVGSIVAGTVTYQIEDQPPVLLGPGDVFFEPEGERIARFDAGDEGVRFLAYFLLSAGQEPQITMPLRTVAPRAGDHESHPVAVGVGQSSRDAS